MLVPGCETGFAVPPLIYCQQTNTHRSTYLPHRKTPGGSGEVRASVDAPSEDGGAM
jgi:hypothetical protein